MNRLIVTVPGLVVVSEMNRRDHWTTRRRRFKTQYELVTVALVGVSTENKRLLRRVPHVRLTIVRYGGRKWDRDNNISGLKHVQDIVSGWMLRDDGDEDRLTLDWKQEPGRGERGVRLEFEWDAPAGVQEQPTSSAP